MNDGRRHRVELVWIRASIYEEPVIFASDCHKDCAAVLDVVGQEIDPADWVFIALGDMAGATRRGEAGNPTSEYVRIHQQYKKFYFVDGNHDRPDSVAYQLENSDKTKCCLQGSVGTVGTRRITGVSGILSRSNQPGKLSHDVFENAVESALLVDNLHTLVTHETPLVRGFLPYIGKRLLTDLLQLIPPAVHAFGHCHLRPISVTDDHTVFVNASDRVLLVEPE